MSENTKIVPDATCTFCGCVCDDMDLTVEEHHRIIKAKNACVLGKAWFLNHGIEERPVAPHRRPGGQRRSRRSSAAAQILAEARFPIIYGLSRHDLRSPARGGRHRRLDRRHHRHHHLGLPRALGHRLPGRRRESPASLGEIKNRADMVVFWGGNPAESHPRHFTRMP